MSIPKRFSASLAFSVPVTYYKHLHQNGISWISIKRGIHHILIKHKSFSQHMLQERFFFFLVFLKWYLWYVVLCFCVCFSTDTYVKLTLLNSMGQEMSKCKTSIRRGQPNPVYKETFVFQVALFQLSDVTLILSVYNKRSMKRKEMIGWISLGLNSSGEEELNHWTEMKESKGQQVCRWHALLESWGGGQALATPGSGASSDDATGFYLAIVTRVILWRIAFDVLPKCFQFCGKTI